MRGAEIALANMCCCRLLVRTWAAAAGVSGRRAPAAPIFCSPHAGGVAARPALSLRHAPASTAPGRTHAPREHNHVTFCCAYLPTVCKRQALPALPRRCNTGELYKVSYHLVSATPRSSPNVMSIPACARSRVQGVPSAARRLRDERRPASLPVRKCSARAAARRKPLPHRYKTAASFAALSPRRPHARQR